LLQCRQERASLYVIGHSWHRQHREVLLLLLLLLLLLARLLLNQLGPFLTVVIVVNSITVISRSLYILSWSSHPS
jgi:hypothetical protein